MTTYQKNFLDIITQRLPEGEKLVDFISRLIHIGREASYRRIRCEVEFTLSEVVILAKALNINLTSLIIREGGEAVTCNLRSVEESSIYTSYAKRIEVDLNVLEGFEKRQNCKIQMVHHTIPDVLFSHFPALTRLSLLKTQLNNEVVKPLRFDQITVSEDIKRLQVHYWDMVRDFDLTLILGPDPLVPLVNDIIYFSRYNLLTQEDTALLKDELYRLLDLLHDIATKGVYLDTKVALYLSPVSLNVSHASISSDDLEASVINLPYTNSILSFDKKFNTASAQSLYRIKKSASCITQSSELERATFLQRQRQLVANL